MDKLTLQMVEVISSSLTQQTGQLEKYLQQLIKLSWIPMEIQSLLMVFIALDKF